MLRSALLAIALTAVGALVGSDSFQRDAATANTLTPTLRAVVNPKVGMSPGRGRSLSMVLGTCTTRMRRAERSATNRADKAVSSPPMVWPRRLPTVRFC